MEPISPTQRRLLWTGCVVGLLSSVALMMWYWPGALPQDSSSGVWTALAQDFAKGVFYRPTYSAFGFGGTRYMPLFFVVHGVLIRLAFDPVTAGVVLTVLGIVLFDAALFLTLRELGVDWPVAVPLALLPHAAVSFQLLSLQVKGDFLAAALNLGGIWCGLRYARRRAAPWLVACVLCCLGAFLTKLTAVAGAVLIWGWLWERKDRRAAGAVGGSLALLAALALGGVYWASDGRALASFRAVATGGMHLGYAVAAPVWLLLAAVQDPVFLLVVSVAALYSVDAIRRKAWTVPATYFWLAAGVTVVIFSSPGTDTNHLLDLLAASVLVFGERLTHAPRTAKLAVALPVVFAGLIALTWLPGMISIKSLIEKGGKPERRSVAVIARRLGPAAHDLLSENPILPVELGERPRVLDPFNLRLLASQRPDIAADFGARIARGQFGAVVLVDHTGADPQHVAAALRACRGSEGDRCYGDLVFPPGFLELLEQRYALSFVVHPFVVYEPRTSATGVALGPRAGTGRGVGAVPIGTGFSAR